MGGLAELISFDFQCSKHPQVWKPLESSYALGCTLTSAYQLLEIYEERGNTTAVHFQALGIAAQDEFPRKIIGGVLGVLPGLGLAIAFPGERGWGNVNGYLWLGVMFAGGSLGSWWGGRTGKYGDVNSDEMFLKAMQAYNDDLATNR